MKQEQVDALAATTVADEPAGTTEKGVVCEEGRVYAGQYLVKSLLGCGGMGEVYLVEHQTLKADFALKVMRPLYRTRPDTLQRFRAESRALWELNHPNFVKVHHAGDDPEIGPYMAMEVLRGKTLAQLFFVMGKLELDDALPIGIEVAETAQAMHELGIIHRDLKPENIFLPVKAGSASKKARTVKLLDLGAAKIAKYGGPATAENRTIGTGKYMSPEHIRCQKLGPTSDIYALSHILYELMTGSHAFGAHHPNPSHFDFQMWHLNAQPEPLSQRLPDAPQELSEVLAKAMAKKAEERFASMSDFAGALRTVLNRALAPPLVRGGTSVMQLPSLEPGSHASTIEEVLSSASPDGQWSFPGALPARPAAQGTQTAEVHTSKDPVSKGLVLGAQNADGTSQPDEPPRSGPIVGHLTVRDGTQAGMRFPLETKAYSVGRDATTDISIVDERLAPVHARIVVHPTGITEVREEQPGCTVLVNDRPGPYHVLRHGDRVRLGGVDLEFRMADPERHSFGSRGTVRIDAPQLAQHPTARKTVASNVSPSLMQSSPSWGAIRAGEGSVASPPRGVPATADAQAHLAQAGVPASQPRAPLAPTPPMGLAPKTTRMPQVDSTRTTTDSGRIVVVAVVLLLCLVLGGVALAKYTKMLGRSDDRPAASQVG